jgi:hypothetical protein
VVLGGEKGLIDFLGLPLRGTRQGVQPSEQVIDFLVQVPRVGDRAETFQLVLKIFR